MGRNTQQPWEKVHEAVEVKLLKKDGEVYVLAKSAGRVDKERSMPIRLPPTVTQRTLCICQVAIPDTQPLFRPT